MSEHVQIDEVLKQYRALTQKECIRIKTHERTPENVFDSKFGGLPYLPHDTSCPVTESGEQLHFLAQYHLDELPPNNIGLPSIGMLQFWVLMDEYMGINNDNHIINDKHRVIYYETIDQSVTRDDVQKKYTYPEHEIYNPVFKELAITFELGQNVMSFGDRYSDGIRSKIDGFSNLSESDHNKFWLAVNEEGHFIGGHPVYPAHDVRDTRYSETFNKLNIDYSKHDVLLLQMDSEMNDDGKNLIVWGDVGNAHFLITKDDLACRDFSNVLYEWSCY
ncbi:YwqG family protein [Macrococcus sp. DPC7161]|uniref:YwqG family protein n=1 Tax=Macrococcus sp. DPC7161 TaxID=2507060 RepID=UPI00100BC313|nr:YwqG family protein [Macrococcus sp. DPC7161]RXK17873.1 DUF1963 domain-containing protein [Macrococcus sp. DPC7161]